MVNCENCRWRKDLVKFQRADDGAIIKTYQDGYACLGYSCDDLVAWFTGISDISTFCDMYTPKEE